MRGTFWLPGRRLDAATRESDNVLTLQAIWSARGKNVHRPFHGKHGPHIVNKVQAAERRSVSLADPSLVGSNEPENPGRKDRYGGRIRQEVRQRHPDELYMLLPATQGGWIEISVRGGKKLEDKVDLVVATAGVCRARLGRAGRGIGRLELAEGGLHRAQEVARGQLYAEFLADLSRQGLGCGLSELHVPAGQERVAVLAVPAQQELTVMDQGATSDKLYCLSRHV